MPRTLRKQFPPSPQGMIVNTDGYRPRCVWICLVAFCVLFEHSWGAEPGTFEKVGLYIGHGGVESEIVGPGRSNGTVAYYATFSYGRDTFDFVEVDPKTGATKVFPNPVAGEYGARAMQ